MNNFQGRITHQLMHAEITSPQLMRLPSNYVYLTTTIKLLLRLGSHLIRLLTNIADSKKIKCLITISSSWANRVFSNIVLSIDRPMTCLYHCKIKYHSHKSSHDTCVKSMCSQEWNWSKIIWNFPFEETRYIALCTRFSDSRLHLV